MFNTLLKFSLAITLAFILNGCGADDPARMKKGDELYSYYCKDCHLKSGLGAFYENLPKERTKMQDYEIVLMIKHGYSSGHQMPVFTQLSDEQADALARYVVEIQNL